MIKYILAILLPAFLLSGCGTQFGIQKPANVTMTQAEEGLVNAYAHLLGSLSAVNDMAAKGSITPAQKTQYVARLDEAKKTLDGAVATVNTTGGQSAVATTLQVLLILQSELQARAAK